MQNTIVSFGDAVVGRLVLGIVTVSSAHPVVFVGILAVLLVLVLAVWADLLAGDRASQGRDAAATGPAPAAGVWHSGTRPAFINGILRSFTHR